MSFKLPAGLNFDQSISLRGGENLSKKEVIDLEIQLHRPIILYRLPIILYRLSIDDRILCEKS